ncbi:MAG: GH1 family beta-glucosidase [Candidatus Binatia bacterium]
MSVLAFPDGFLWGAATSAYQIEGSPLADGAGASIWHQFAHRAGNISNGENADLACDHYRRYREDVVLMKELGLKAYRFSISWPRVLPAGSGAINQKGMDFYRKLCDSLLDVDIVPVVTLYHWDLPQALEDQGGWPSSETAACYADYAEQTFRALGDRVSLWISFNEPWVFTYLGYALGIHAPGRADTGAALQAGHTVLRAHAMASQRLATVCPRSDLGITLSVQAVLPLSRNSADLAAAERYGAFVNEWFIEPLTRGDYPQAMREQFGGLLPEITGTDRELLRNPPDFIGLNYYTRCVVEDDPTGFFRSRVMRPTGHRTAMDWETYPAGLYHVLREFSRRYSLPLYVTENGAGLENEQPDERGFVTDDLRLRYLQSHFEMAHRAISEGVDLRGYMVWSLLDNFEWSFGYSKRFGIVRCDYTTLERIPKKSARWYRRVIEENGV